MDHQLQMAPYPAVPPASLPPAPTPDDEPLYVNAKQYHRIIKRREARIKQAKAAQGRKPYLHESRHKHAMRRPRGPGGRFLTAEEVKELDVSKKILDQEASSICINIQDQSFAV